MAWIYLIIAGVMEICWAVGLKYTEGFTKLYPSIFTLSTLVISFWLLALAVRSLPIGTAYAVWTGIGAAGTAIIGMIFLGESREVAKIVCIVLIVSGIIGLKLFSK
jgi:quaternary ammonium compound-resistance protein SugE